MFGVGAGEDVDDAGGKPGAVGGRPCAVEREYAEARRGTKVLADDVALVDRVSDRRSRGQYEPSKHAHRRYGGRRDRLYR